MTLYILRGLPGSGKSTFAKKLAERSNCVICSTDNYFVNDAGQYIFNGRDLSKNHQKNLANARIHLSLGYDVVIDNTNIYEEHFRPYISVARQYGATVVVIRFDANIEDCVARNVHGVPEHTIRKMAANFKAYEGEIPFNEFHL